MDVFVCTHALPSIRELTEAKMKAQVPLELDSYFEKLMHINNNETW